MSHRSKNAGVRGSSAPDAVSTCRGNESYPTSGSGAPKTVVSSLKLSAEGPWVSRLALGVWRLPDWGLDAPGLLTLIEQCLDWQGSTVELRRVPCRSTVYEVQWRIQDECERTS